MPSVCRPTSRFAERRPTSPGKMLDMYRQPTIQDHTNPTLMLHGGDRRLTKPSRTTSFLALPARPISFKVSSPIEMEEM